MKYETKKSLPYILEINQKTYISQWIISKQESFFNINNSGPKFIGKFLRIEFSPIIPFKIDGISE